MKNISEETLSKIRELHEKGINCPDIKQQLLLDINVQVIRRIVNNPFYVPGKRQPVRSIKSPSSYICSNCGIKKPSRNSGGRLNISLVRDIRCLYLYGAMTRAQITATFRVCSTTISLILLNKIWKDANYTPITAKQFKEKRKLLETAVDCVIISKLGKNKVHHDKEREATTSS